jgi:predicted Rossmann fold nucleotide-binding protein DprA/Smf involved in DNA uptake
MKEIDVFLKTVVEGMKAMAQGIEALADKLDTIKTSRVDVKGKTKPAGKAPSKQKKSTAKKAASKEPVTAAETVLKIINRSKKGVSPAIISEKTGFAPKKVHNVVYKLKKQGKIKSIGKGVYLKV